MDDKDIIDLYLKRQESAIHLTKEKYGARLRSLALGIVKDVQTAEECENDTYLRAWNSIPPNEPWEHFYAFLACISRHISLDICRSRNRLKRSAYICELSDEMEQCLPAPDNCEQQIDDMALREILNDYLGTLSVEKRNIFLRRYWYLDPLADIAKRFSISEGKVKSTLFRCREQLRKHLEKEGYKL